ncbi:MAG TPA: glycosyltransferase family 39 protein [Alphaproteobacteria bacterium]|nr:glycosyltransferase family 39 protein [Alphaproteobacteria bacterium]
MALWSCLLFALYTEGNGFPAPWHWDEPSKVAQLSGAAPNFHHPRLLLDATQAVLAFERHPTSQDIAVAGRYVSAVSAILTVGLLAVLTLLLYGQGASLLVALMVGLNPLFYGLAHYMKEDTVHVFGLCLFLLAFALYDRKPDWPRLAALGAAAGVAAAGKYPGAAMMPIAIGLVVWRGRLQRDATRITAAKAGLVAILAACVFLALDWQIFTQSDLFRTGLRGSARQAAVGDFGALYRPIYSGFYLKGLFELCTPVAIAAFVGYLVLAYRSKSRAKLVERAIALLPLLYLLVLQASPSKRIRYELPAILLIITAAAVFIAYLAQRRNRLELRILAALAVMAILSSDYVGISAMRTALLNDSRAEMAGWIRAHLPRNMVIGVAHYTGFIENGSSSPGPADVPTKLVEALPNSGTVEQLRAAGVTHVLLSEMTFARYFNPSFAVDANDVHEAEEVAQYRVFYRELFARAVLVHHVGGAMADGTCFSPELWLFDIRGNADRQQNSDQPREPPTFSTLQD